MPSVQDGPRSPLFAPLSLQGNVALSNLADVGLSDEMTAALEHAPSGDCVAWGIPFETTTRPEAGSKRTPTTALSGCGFSHAQSQLIHGLLSAAALRVCVHPHPSFSCSCAALKGWGLWCATASKQFSPQWR